jgi:hypothetical protein
MLLAIDSRSWEEGFTAGENWKSVPASHNPYAAGSIESYSWLSGWIEGNAKEQGFNYSKGVAK